MGRQSQSCPGSLRARRSRTSLVSFAVPLLCGVFTLGAASVASVLFLIFTVGQASALMRGLDADCGCFGAGEKVGWASLPRTAALLGGAGFCLGSALRAPGSVRTGLRPASVPLPQPA